MFGNHIKFAFRNIARNKTFSAINIGGLVVSLSAFLLMALYIENELSYDAFHSKANSIYRVVDDKQANGLLQHSASTAAPVAPALLTDFPQIKQAVRIIGAESLVKYQDKLFEERGVFFADDNLFKVFDFKLMRGNSATALKEPNTIVLTAKTAEKYFGNADPIGKTLTLDNNKSMQVTGVVANVPANSHLSFDFLISMATAKQKNSGYDWLFTNWYSNNFYTYILLPVGYNAAAITSRVAEFDKRHRAATSTTKHNYGLEKLTDIYLRSDRENQAGKTGNITTLYIFSAIALFILLIACINFINLSTARAAERAREVAIKKVNGVSRGQLIVQFFAESYLMTSIALVSSLLISALLLPSFNSFAGKSITYNLLSPVHIAAVGTIFLVTGLLSGSYPAIILSSFKPVTALKGNIRSSLLNIGIRKGLVVFQFVISIILIISSIVVYSQLQFMQKHDLGFRSSQTLVINFEGDNSVQQNYKLIKNELLRIPGIKNVSASSNVPGNSMGSGWSMDIAKKTGDTVHTEMPIYLTDFNFMRQFNIKMIAGRALSESYAADTAGSMLINESALHKLGFNSADEAIGVNVGMYPTNGKIIGVYKDFHFESLQKAIQPLAIRVIPDKFRLFSLAINTSDVKQTVANVEQTWKKLAPQRPLEYAFLDETFNRQYEAEVKFGQVFGVFTTLAITIACFGLFGLALFSVKQRRKEIGIRKVIGASAGQITALLSKDFISLVFIAIVVASPIAWFIMNKWIQPFAYRIQISWWIFVTGGLVAMVIALTTVAFQAVKAAIVNPVESLRSE